MNSANNSFLISRQGPAIVAVLALIGGAALQPLQCFAQAPARPGPQEVLERVKVDIAQQVDGPRVTQVGEHLLSCGQHSRDPAISPVAADVQPVCDNGPDDEARKAKEPALGVWRQLVEDFREHWPSLALGAIIGFVLVSLLSYGPFF